VLDTILGSDSYPEFSKAYFQIPKRIHRYILFHNKRHPQRISKTELKRFSRIPLCKDCSFNEKSSPQTLLSLYREGINVNVTGIDVVHAKRPQYMPTVLSKQEAITPEGALLRIAVIQ
jgi:hypothetical protein